MELHETKQKMLLDKLAKRSKEIAGYRISNVQPIENILLRETPEYEKLEDAVAADGYKPIKVGDLWGGYRVNGWFKLSITVPEEFQGKQVAAYIAFDGEGCAFIDGKPVQGLDPNHEEILLLTDAEGGERFDIVIDAMCKGWAHAAFGATRNVPYSVLYRAEIATRNPEVTQYWYDLDFLRQLAVDLPADSPRRAKIIYTLNKSVDAFDYTNKDADSLKASAIRARAILKPLMECKADASATSIAAHGHAHIDTAWLWPYRETIRKCSRTFSTVVRLMEQYPEYIYSQSQGQLYEFTKERWPSLYEEIKARAKEGRWDVMGSMWVEADCNICSGESLVRQILVGKNFFMDEFGVETDTLWLPDVFGYSAAIPQILKKSGVDYFSTIKIHWNQFNKFPYSTFYWKGIDGTRVLAHFPPAGDYNALPEPAKLRSQVSRFIEKDRSEWSLMSFGWGDGGGGPEARHSEYFRRAADLEGLPKCKQMRVSEFFHKIDCEADFPEWFGELYFELHRGTYTTQARNKMLNRKSELRYRDAEFLSSVAEPMGLGYPREALLKEWKKILCNQFHDVIPGSSIREVYEDTEVMYAEIMEFGRETAWTALGKIAQNIDTSGGGWAAVVFNTLPWDRHDLANVGTPGDGEYAIVDSDGSEVQSQQVADALIFNAAVPSMGYNVYRIVDRKAASAESGFKVSEAGMENKFLKLALDSDGQITSMVLKSNGREVLPQGGKGNLLQVFEDKPNNYDAWDVEYFHLDKAVDLTSPTSFKVTESGPVRGTVEVEHEFGKSKLRQQITMYADSPRVDFRTWVDWHEDEKCLKAAFPVDINAAEARYEIQFGNAVRPAHTNTSWDFARFEVCGHKWVDYSENGFGLSLMNDCKYGHHVANGQMQITLLRSPKSPDPMADMCEHEFTYSIMPHEGDYTSAQTVRRAYELNVPLVCQVDRPSPGTLPTSQSFISVDADNVILETVKKAEKGEATILRFYECHNSRAEAKVTLKLPFKRVYECDLMERNITEIKTDGQSFNFEAKPFEIKTFKLVG